MAPFPLYQDFLKSQENWYMDHIYIYGPRQEKTCLWRVVNNKGTDQPAHLCSLVSAYVIRLMESTISRLTSSEISCFRLVSVAEQASLNLIQSPRRQGFSRLGP